MRRPEFWDKHGEITPTSFLFQKITYEFFGRSRERIGKTLFKVAHDTDRVHTPMKHHLYSLILFLGAAFTAQAQTQIATLNHEGTVSMFYHANALKSAYEKAVDGDVITLSAGSFNAVDFSKNITVRGAGMGVQVDSAAATIEPTILVGSFTVSAAGTTAQYFSLEGIKTDNNTLTIQNATYAQFAKCNFYTVYLFSNQYLNFIHCYFRNSAGGYSTTLNATSCFINGFNPNNSTTSTSTTHQVWTLNNCILNQSKSLSSLNKIVITSCILIDKTESYSTSTINYYIPTNSTPTYCLYKGSSTNPFKNFNDTISGYHNAIFTGSELFVPNTFGKLTAEAKKHLGDDGTEVGIYGGSMPFDPTPFYPQITNFKVAPKTTSSGTLRVDMDITEP